MKKNKIFISICSRKFSKQLLILLKSLVVSQRYKNLNINILILFNSLNKINSDQLKRINIILDKIKFYIIYEKKLGVSNARNKTLLFLKKKDFQFATFLDDDCFINKDFLISHLNFIKKYNCDVVGGPQIYSSSKNTFRIFERNYPQMKNVSWVSTNNVFLKKKVLEKKVYFSNRVTKYGFGEDQLFFSKLHKLGITIKWNNNPVFENVNNKMKNFQWFLNRNYKYGLTGVLIDKELNKMFVFFLLNFLKIIYYLFKSIFYFLLIPINPTKYFYFSIGFLIRFFGRIIGQKNIL